MIAPGNGDAGAPALLAVRDLVVEYRVSNGVVRGLDSVSFELGPNERLGIVGESGSGKTTLGLAIAALLSKNARVVSGSIRYNGEELVGAPNKRLRRLRGDEIAVVFQDAKTALDPVRTIGSQIVEAITAHRDISRLEARDLAGSLLREVDLPRPADRLKQYPHELSGGMRQRAMMAMALAGRPKLLIADEPTSALDVTTQANIMELLNRIGEERSMSTILITHDLSVVAGFADKVLVLYAGAAMELGETELIFARAAHPYSRALIAAVPSLEGPRRRRLDFIPGGLPSLEDPLPGCRFAPRCPIAEEQCSKETPPFELNARGTVTACWLANAIEPQASPGNESGKPSDLSASSDVVDRERPGELLRVDAVSKSFQIRRKGDNRRVRLRAVDEVSFHVRRGESFGVVGESGSGKTTLGRMIVGLTTADGGGIELMASEPSRGSGPHHARRRGDVQMVFQDPSDSLDPHFDVERIIAEPLVIVRRGRYRRYRGEVRDALNLVGLSTSVLHRRPDELSGGQRQRVAIARVLTTAPDLVIADEAVASLDMSARGQVLNLLADLQERTGLTMIHISHDLSLVRHICERVAVMHAGRIVELADTASLFKAPKHPYTAGLLSSVPVPDPVVQRSRARVAVRGDPPDTTERQVGCPYRSRCPRAQELCATEDPSLLEHRVGHFWACHFPVPDGAVDLRAGRPASGDEKSSSGYVYT